MLLTFNANNQLPPVKMYLKLVKKEDRKFFISYMEWLKLLFYRGLGLKKTKLNNFNNLYKAVYKQWNKSCLLGYLQSEFIKRNLSLSLLLEPIDGFSWIAKNRYDLDYTKAITILLQIIFSIILL